MEKEVGQSERKTCIGPLEDQLILLLVGESTNRSILNPNTLKKLDQFPLTEIRYRI